jgi:hypothetical protein
MVIEDRVHLMVPVLGGGLFNDEKGKKERVCDPI